MSTFRTRLILIILALVLIPLVGSGITMMLSTTEALEEASYKENASNALVLASQVDVLLENVEGNLRIVAESAGVKTMKPIQMVDLLVRTVNQNPAIGKIYAIDPSGQELFKTSGTLANRSESDYFKQAVEGNTVYSEVVPDERTGEPIVVLAMPVYNGGLVGVIAADIELSVLSEMAADIEVGEGGTPSSWTKGDGSSPTQTRRSPATLPT